MKATEKTFNGLRISGFLALFLILALSGLSCYLIAGINETWSVITGIVGLCLLAVCLLGLMEIEPNNARVMLFFGKYKGTITDNGFFWVNPLYSKKKITLRARNFDVPPIKVNDKVGNPVMIGAVMYGKSRILIKRCSTSILRPLVSPRINHSYHWENPLNYPNECRIMRISCRYKVTPPSVR